MPVQAALRRELRQHRGRVNQLRAALCLCTAADVAAAAEAELDALNGDDVVRFGLRYERLADLAHAFPYLAADYRPPCPCEWLGLSR